MEMLAQRRRKFAGVNGNKHRHRAVLRQQQPSADNNGQPTTAVSQQQTSADNNHQPTTTVSQQQPSADNSRQQPSVDNSRQPSADNSRQQPSALNRINSNEQVHYSSDGNSCLALCASGGNMKHAHLCTILPAN